MAETLTVIAAKNGRVQVSAGAKTIGLLVERGNLCAGILLSSTAARDLARVLLNGSWAHEASDTSGASLQSPSTRDPRGHRRPRQARRG